MLVGPGSDNVGYQCGGWTTYWQGTTASDIGVGISIMDAFERELTANGASLVDNISQADTVVIVLTELPYSEGSGDNSSLTLTTGNSHPDNMAAINIAIEAQNQGKNVVAILISGRPLLLEDYLQYFDSFVAAWLPGSEGGNGISDVIFGDYDFTGKLSFTWPMNNSQFGYNSNNDNYIPSSVMYPYGYGMSYNN
jgi:beta-glucosidase